MKNAIKNFDEDFDFYGINTKIIEEMKINSALRDRRIYISESINEDSIFKTMYLLKRIVDIDKKTDTKLPIELVIDSFGGQIYYGLALIGYIEHLKTEGYKIITITNSVAMSMGFMLLLVGSERISLSHARIMCHQPSSATWGSLQTQQESVEETLTLWLRLKDIIKKYTKITDEQLEDIKTRKYDWFMWSDEALKLGIIDKILV